MGYESDAGSIFISGKEMLNSLDRECRYAMGHGNDCMFRPLLVQSTKRAKYRQVKDQIWRLVRRLCKASTKELVVHFFILSRDSLLPGALNSDSTVLPREQPV